MKWSFATESRPVVATVFQRCFLVLARCLTRWRKMLAGEGAAGCWAAAGGGSVLVLWLFCKFRTILKAFSYKILI